MNDYFDKTTRPPAFTGRGITVIGILFVLLIAVAWIRANTPSENEKTKQVKRPVVAETPVVLKKQTVTPEPLIRLAVVPYASPRQPIDSSGFTLTIPRKPWPNDAALETIKEEWISSVQELGANIDQQISKTPSTRSEHAPWLAMKASYLMSAGKASQAYDLLTELRSGVQARGTLDMQKMLGSTVYFQGLAALRLGENENCIMCTGESACILPIQESAIHKRRRGSSLAVEHFTEYLEAFPDDLEVQWLLNLAHMTLGDYPDKVDPKYLLKLGNFHDSDKIGRFKNVSHLLGVNRFDQAGGAIMDDFDNDGFFDLVETSFDVKEHMAVYKNLQNGKFEDRTDSAKLTDQLGGLQCMQTDYNNDGLLDIFIVRGAWLPYPIRPTLLRNDGGFRFTDVTVEAGLAEPVNSNSAQWADFDNDGWLDLFVCCEQQTHRLYRNLRDGKFEEMAEKANLASDGKSFGKGCVWFDYDNDRDPDLFINNLNGRAELHRNNGDSTFTDVSEEMGIDGPEGGFSCWAFDFNNDGWLDLFATCYARTVKDIAAGLIGRPHSLESNRLFLNEQGKGFKDVTAECGLDLVFSAMGSNFGDFDNDGFLDFYLGTGDPAFSTLVPNRMFKNIEGSRFSEVTFSAGVGHLQKGHSVACGDWDRNGNIDLFVQTGGAVDGDKFHNLLFNNPGNDNAWLSIKLEGEKSNSAGIGSRIKIQTKSPNSRTICREVTSGSSFGANPLELTIGLGNATGIEVLEIYWPSTDRTQIFRDLPVNQSWIVREESDELITRNLRGIELDEFGLSVDQ